MIVGEDADDLGAPLDLAIEALDGVGAVKLGLVQYVFFGGVHELGELRYFRPDLVGDVAPLGACGLRCVLAKAVAMKAETTHRPLFPAWASAFLMKRTRGLLNNLWRRRYAAATNQLQSLLLPCLRRYRLNWQRHGCTRTIK